MPYEEPETPSYEEEIALLVAFFVQAVEDIQRQLDSFLLNGADRKAAQATLKEITAILAALDVNTTEWTNRNVPIAVSDGVALALVTLGVAKTLNEAREVVKLRPAQRELVEMVSEEMVGDLKNVGVTIAKKIRTALRQVTADVLRTKSVDLQKHRATLIKAANSGYIDTSPQQRRWKPGVYAENVAMTQLSEAQREASISEGASRKVLYGVISRHNAKDACRNWESKIVKLVPDAPGDYTYIRDINKRDLFHPRCKHVVTPFSNFDMLPDYVKESNGL
jgi:hypothetical protein